mgnify:CR=1 FL=1
MTAATLRGSAPPDAEVWLSVQDASAMLGVSPATLRRWSAAGEVEAFTTPGGHRRFALSTLKALLPNHTESHARPAAVGESSDRLVKVIRRHSRSATHDNAWTRTLDQPTMERVRHSCRALTVALVRHLDAVSRGSRGDTLQSAEFAARDLGVLLALQGCGLVESFGTFLRFRGLILKELSAAAVRSGLATAEATALVTRGGEAVDRLLEALVAAHSEASSH